MLITEQIYYQITAQSMTDGYLKPLRSLKIFVLKKNVTEVLKFVFLTVFLCKYSSVSVYTVWKTYSK